MSITATAPSPSPRSSTSEEPPTSLTPNYKGKGKQVDDDDEASSPNSEHALDSPSYPPVNEDDLETRRVEETLKRWEVAERQRRKAARESTSGQPTPTPSLMAGVSQRASILWSSKRKSKPPSQDGFGKHAALQSRDDLDVVPLQDVAVNSAALSPTFADSADNSAALLNPFLGPLETVVASPFADPPNEGVVEPSDDTVDISEAHTIHKKNSSVQSSSTNPIRPPTPRPIDLPPPRTPPPRVSSPSTEDLETPKPEPTQTRWWHEWLCGCGEGPDRGGDYQAGRTNPFE